MPTHLYYVFFCQNVKEVIHDVQNQCSFGVKVLAKMEKITIDA